MDRPRTCRKWVNNTCPKTAESCLHSHHLFPSIVMRAHDNSTKAKLCAYQPECEWPDSVCGFKHLSDMLNPDSELKLAQAEDRMLWDTHVVLTCKVETCKQELFSTEAMVKHVQDKHPEKWYQAGDLNNEGLLWNGEKFVANAGRT